MVHGTLLTVRAPAGSVLLRRRFPGEGDNFPCNPSYPFAFKRSRQLQEPAPAYQAIRIREGQNVTPARLDAPIPGIGYAAPAFPQISNRKLLDDLGRAVFRPIVYDKDLVSLSRVIHP
jgi:hypothetical protein